MFPFGTPQEHQTVFLASSDFDEIFTCLGNRASDVTEAYMNATESFVIKIYTKMSTVSLTDLRIGVFKSLTDNDLQKLPPSRRALNNTLEELIMFDKSQLVISVSLIPKTGMGI